MRCFRLQWRPLAAGGQSRPCRQPRSICCPVPVSPRVTRVCRATMSFDKDELRDEALQTNRTPYTPSNDELNLSTSDIAHRKPSVE
ncbi:unnamed protein product [Plutella xylostella]|uniref:(diamondback moth) hypothetical protein n=1 Tax=Plutella xylostella TaxID=51655 RepID=A0A8S4G469_PLUXY|nr:unnamed protein product [Plutella xylostella]